MSSAVSDRLKDDLEELFECPIPEIVIAQEKVSKDYRVWDIDVLGPKNSPYEKDRFQVRFTFPAKYPSEPPVVVFVGPNIPVHPQVFTNGHIYMEILDTVKKYWSDRFCAHNICMEIILMLKKQKSKQKPASNDQYVRSVTGNPDYKLMRM